MTSNEESQTDPLCHDSFQTEIKAEYKCNLLVIKEEKHHQDEHGKALANEQDEGNLNVAEPLTKVEKEEPSDDDDEVEMDISSFLNFEIQTKNGISLQVKEDRREEKSSDPSFIWSDIPENNESISVPGGSTDELVLLCGVCKRTFKNKTYLEHHTCEFDPKIKIPPAMRDIVTDLGDGRFSYRDRQFEITKTTKYGSEVACYKCSTCDRLYVHSLSLLRHIRANHSGDDQLTCDICKKSFEDEDSLQGHVCAVARHTIKQYRKVKDLGNGTFILLDRWSFHLEGHYYVCDECGVKKKVMEKMTHHITTAHSNPEGERVKKRCDECSKWTSQEKPHVCPETNKRFPKAERRHRSRYYYKDA